MTSLCAQDARIATFCITFLHEDTVHVRTSALSFFPCLHHLQPSVMFQDRKDKLRQHLTMLLSVDPAQAALSGVESILNPRVKLGTLQ